MTTDQPEPDPRQALKDELWGMGVPDAAAEALLAAWDAWAREAGIAGDDDDYWTRAAAWIDRERGAS